MTTEPEYRIRISERLADGVFIEFSDGKSALYPASFLRAHLAWYQLDSMPNRREEPTSP